MLKFELEQAEANYREAYALAYVTSPDHARILFNIPVTKVTTTMMDQIAVNDPVVKGARDAMLAIKKKIAASEAGEESRKVSSKTPEETIEDVLSGIIIDDINLGDSGVIKGVEATAFEIYEMVYDQIRQISENLKELTAMMESRSGNWSRDFWESDILENAVIYKTELTDYIEILRSLTKKNNHKLVSSELRAVISHAYNLRDDFKSIVEIAKIQFRGF
jgi:hypothetical protein